ncbi:hypothetical protein HAX54_040028 [Datura stramonium]|uniref:Uncharacterized protein n=1 Tax=Datura stramonium TaxID=4076 RepID=A0ABS8RNT1_DATST|nr:hypothetical protein [Datura stramonium]
MEDYILCSHLWEGDSQDICRMMEIYLISLRLKEHLLVQLLVACWCIHPLDTIKTKLQTKGASEICSGTIDVIVKTFQSKGILGFHSGVSSVIVGSTASFAVWCNGSIVSSAIMVPKELIAHRMQAGAKREVLAGIDESLGKRWNLGVVCWIECYIIDNFPAGVVSCSSFEHLKHLKEHLEPFQSDCCGARAGVISASLTTPLDVGEH